MNELPTTHHRPRSLGVTAMTHKQTMQAIRSLGLSVSFDSDTSEYRINFECGSERTAYYTDDRVDAINTAKAMAS